MSTVAAVIAAATAAATIEQGKPQLSLPLHSCHCSCHYGRREASDRTSVNLVLVQPSLRLASGLLAAREGLVAVVPKGEHLLGLEAILAGGHPGRLPLPGLVAAVKLGRGYYNHERPQTQAQAYDEERVKHVTSE